MRSLRTCSRSGFTLMELMAVLLILAILGGILVSQLGEATDAVDRELTEIRMSELSALISSYSQEHGDHPLSTWREEWGSAPDATNLGAECLFVALFSEAWDGEGIEDEWLVNTDGDEARRNVTVLGTRELFEIGDAWGNPIAYFHRSDYGRTDAYLTEDPISGELVEGVVGARKSEKTGRWAEHRGFQLLSAGSDGEFGTEDDLTSFGR